MMDPHSDRPNARPWKSNDGITAAEMARIEAQRKSVRIRASAKRIEEFIWQAIAAGENPEIARAQAEELERKRRLCESEAQLQRRVPEGPSRVPGGSRGARTRTKSNKKAPKPCRHCGSDVTVCLHQQRGRNKLENPKDEKLRPYLPKEFIDFLKRSDLPVSVALEAVLGSKAMACWRRHADFQRPDSVYDENGYTVYDESDNEIKLTAFDARVREAERSPRHYLLDGKLENQRWLKNLRPNLGPRIDERISSSLLKRVTEIGKSAPQPERWHPVRYSQSTFIAYCIEYYIACVRRIQNNNASIYDLQSSREEAKAVKDVATHCFYCERR